MVEEKLEISTWLREKNMNERQFLVGCKKKMNNSCGFVILEDGVYVIP